MYEKNNSSGGLVTGLTIGAALGAGITFLFGTKKGKEVREKFRKEYPEFFETLEEKYDNVVEEVNKLKTEVPKTISKSPRFFRGAKKKIT